MTYVPRDIVHDTQYPRALTKDFATQSRLIEELYRRKYPALQYHPLNIAPTAANIPNLAGETGATKYDPLYREAMDPTLTTWQQPHLDPALAAANPEQHHPAVTLHMRVQRVSRDLDMHKEGVLGTRLVDVFIPVSLLDAQGITCVPSDYIEWNGHSYWVITPDNFGYWKNTNLHFYVKLSCESRAVGS
jgi:hypothetical protein